MSHQKHSLLYNWSRKLMESGITDHAANFQRVYGAGWLRRKRVKLDVTNKYHLCSSQCKYTLYHSFLFILNKYPFQQLTKLFYHFKDALLIHIFEFLRKIHFKQKYWFLFIHIEFIAMKRHNYLKSSPSSNDNEGNNSSNDCHDEKGNDIKPGSVEVVETFSRRIILRFCTSFFLPNDSETKNQLHNHLLNCRTALFNTNVSPTLDTSRDRTTVSLSIHDCLTLLLTWIIKGFFCTSRFFGCLSISWVDCATKCCDQEKNEFHDSKDSDADSLTSCLWM